MIKKGVMISVVTVFIMGCSPKRPPFFVSPSDFYANTGVIHTVVLGDTIDTIAESYDVSVDYIVHANALPLNYRLYVGQQLQIPNEYIHKVGEGENLTEIARLYGVRQLDLATINGLSFGDSVTWGQMIKIPAMRVIRAKGDVPISIADLLEKIVKQGGNIVAIPPEGKGVAPKPSGSEKTNSSTTASVSEKVISVPQFSGFVWPVEGKIVRDFGKVYDGIKSAGINISASAGTSVSSAEGGQVAYVGSGIRGMGNMILIRHDNGYISVYAHLEEMFVAKGDVIDKGDMIGTVGQTGQVTTPQLHFEIRQGKVPIDPNTLLGA